MTGSTRSGFMLLNDLSRRIPALLTTMSTRPKASIAVLHDRRPAVRRRHRVGVGDGLAARRRDLVDDELGGADIGARAVDGAAEVVDHDERAA